MLFSVVSVIINSGGALKSVYPGLELAALKIFFNLSVLFQLVIPQSPGVYGFCSQTQLSGDIKLDLLVSDGTFGALVRLIVLHYLIGQFSSIAFLAPDT